MNLAQFIIAVFGLYLMYYTIIVIYDAYFIKDKTKSENEEQIIDLGQEEAPQEVTDEDIYSEEEKKKNMNKVITSTTEGELSDKVEMVVETQGIPLDKLITEGKQLFADINF